MTISGVTSHIMVLRKCDCTKKLKINNIKKIGRSTGAFEDARRRFEHRHDGR